MGKESESVRFLDDFDLTVSLDSRSNSSQQMTNMEINAKPIVFRASYRDIILITSIVNKAIELSSQRSPEIASGEAQTSLQRNRPSQVTSKKSSSRQTILKGKQSPVGKARVITSKEQARKSTLLGAVKLTIFVF